MAEERRHFPRVRAYLPVRLYQFLPPKVVETLTKDLSAEGVRCVSPITFPVSTELSLEFGLSPGFEPVTLRGRIAWFRTLPYSDQFDVGLSFTEISPQHKRRLSTYLERLQQPSHALSPV